jgi:hypothetical protein
MEQIATSLSTEAKTGVTAEPVARVDAAPDAAEMTRLRAHPLFAQAVKQITGALSEIYEGNRIMNTVLNDRARGQIGYLALIMHWASPSEYAAQGVTMSRMKAACTRMNYCSPNRVESIMALMRLFGYIRLESDPYDHRLKVIVPTEKLIGNHRERWRCNFQAMTLVMPEGGIGLAALDSPGFAPAFLREIAKDYAAGLRVANAAPELDTFLDRNCGMIILLFLVSTGTSDSAAPGILRATVSVSGLARRFGVSRAHVRKLLADAQVQGLVHAKDGSASITLLPRVLEGVDKFCASTFLTFAKAIRGAANA